MKKFVILLVMAALLVFTGLAFADDGINVIEGNMVLIDTGAGYNDNTAPRNFTPGVAYEPQTANVKLLTHAVLPCYLEMTFQGNDENVTIQTFGPGTSYTHNSEMYIAFHPELSGFVDDNWVYVTDSSSLNAEIKPGDGYYIRGCDTFRTVMWANTPYKYSVTCEGLSGNGGTLPIDMRAAVSETDPGFGSESYGVSHTFPTDGNECTVDDNIPAKVGRVVYHQFRVPYTKDYEAGYYSGDITFTATTV